MQTITSSEIDSENPNQRSLYQDNQDVKVCSMSVRN
jgi:hypothetical protein